MWPTGCNVKGETEGEEKRRADVEDRCTRRSFYGFGGFCEFGFCLSVIRHTLYLLTCIPDRSALTRALIIIFALPCRAMSRPGAPTEKFTCRLNGKTKNATSWDLANILNAVATRFYGKLFIRWQIKISCNPFIISVPWKENNQRHRRDFSDKLPGERN